MKGKKTAVESVMGTTMLDEPPHVLSQLVEIVDSDWQPTTTEQEQLLDHLIECEYCQVSLGMLFASELTHDSSADSSENVARKLLARQREAVHERQVHYEQIAAYIETLEAHGEKKANKKYPVLAKHLKHCKDCQFLVESTRALLDQKEKAELDQAEKAEAKRR